MTDNGLRFVVFDCDGTLVDSQYGIYAAIKFSFEQSGLTAPDRSAVNSLVGLHLQEALEQLHPGLEAKQYQRMAQDFRDAIHVHELPETKGSALFPGCREVLEQLNETGHILGVATGMGRRGLDKTLEEQGLDHLFTVTKTADDGPGKPNPDILIDAMREVGADPHETVMIGDTVFDIQTAVNAHTLALGVGWGYHGRDELVRAGALEVVDAFAEIPGILDRFWIGEE